MPTGGGDYYVNTGISMSNIVDYTITTSTSSAPLTVTSTSGPITIGATNNSTIGHITPITVASGGFVYADPPKDELKSKPVLTEEHSHDIQCRLRVESTKVISEYYCHHCEEVLHSKVISEIPQSIINKKCLSRIVKEV